MVRSGSQGIAIAVIDQGQVALVKTWGKRNAKGEPLTPDTVMYGASLTKAMFGYLIAQLADEGKLDLDASIATMLPKPLPAYSDAEARYAPYHHLAGDERWRKLTPRILLNHGSGFANFHFLEPDRRLHSPVAIRARARSRPQRRRGDAAALFPSARHEQHEPDLATPFRAQSG